ncbi:hypothetical protein LCGC14_2915140 [marine sediment metagenome]|uniref:Uncharacterized protein n=1 Tax=marine sediment metagenome TaxID=412755 RepID=A0A0F8YC87_9ZZZZ
MGISKRLFTQHQIDTDLSGQLKKAQREIQLLKTDYNGKTQAFETLQKAHSSLVNQFQESRKAEGALAEALRVLVDDLQSRLDMATGGMTEADGLVAAEDANRSWRSWLFDVMSTYGDIARNALKLTDL